MTFKEFAQKHSPKLRKVKKFFLALSFPFESSLGASDLWVIVFICCVSLFMPKLLWTIPVYVLMKTNRRVVIIAKVKSQPEVLEPIIMLIQRNHLQSLTEAIEANPEILYTHYKKRPLPYWCKFYNNNKALMVINQLIKKHPKDSAESKEKTPIAA